MGLINIKPPSLIIVDPDSAVIGAVNVVIVVVTIDAIRIIFTILRVTSVLTKNVELEMFLESNYGSCFLNILGNSVPNQRSRHLDFVAAIVIICTLGVESEGLLYIASIKIILPNDICAASGAMIMNLMIILKPIFKYSRTIIS